MRQVGADLPLVGEIGAVGAIAADRVAARAAVLDDPLVARLQLLRLGNVGDLGVALDAARLDEPLGKHREIPDDGSHASCALRATSRPARGVGRMRRIGEVGARALAAVADRAAEAVDRMRAVGVEIETGRDHLAARVDGGGAAGQERVRPENRGHLLTVRVLVVADAVDPLVAGRAAVVTRHFLEVVVDRQLGEAELLDLGRRHDVDAGQAAEERHRLASTSCSGPP